MKHLRFPIPLSIAVFLALTLGGTYWVRKGLLERAMRSALETDDEAMVGSLLEFWPCPVNAAIMPYRWEPGAASAPDYVTEREVSPLQWAMDTNRSDIAIRCVQRGAGTEVADSVGRTPLNLAVQKGNRELVRALLDHGADPNAADSHDYTPLHVAAWQGEPAIVELLLNAGAEVNGKTDGETPLCRARVARAREPKADYGLKVNQPEVWDEVIRILLEHGAKE